MSLVEFEKDGEDFESLLNKSFSGVESYNPGQLVESEIISISAGSVFIELDGKSEGIIDSDEFLDDKKGLSVAPGDKIRAYFVNYSNGEMIFTTKISGNKAGKEALKSAYESEIPVEGVVESVIKGGYDIKIGETRAFCPFSQLGLKRIDNPEDYIGTKHSFKITEYSEGGRNILVSARVLLEELRDAKKGQLQQDLYKGMVVSVKVLSLEKFGAFVDLMGIKALLPISEISRSRVNDISTELSVGDEIEVSILNLDWANDKISVSKKALIKDPWDYAEDKYKEDSRHNGEVSRITDYGVFVTLESGLDGLIHVSDFKGDSRDRNSGDNLTIGEKITVQIKSIDVSQKRIGLKEVSSVEEYEANSKYFDDDDDDDTYNPFAALLKDR